MHRDTAAASDQGSAFSAGAQIRVELQDALGGTLQQGSPNAEGKLQFTTCSDGDYRLRITGPTIEDSLVEDLQPGRGDRLVNVELHSKANKSAGTKAAGSTISAQRLRVPSKALKQLKKGDKALQKGQLEVALRYYNAALDLFPQFDEAANNAGVVLMKMGKKADGRQAFLRSLDINPNYAPAQVNLAKIAVDEKQFPQASALALQALRTEPLNTGALFVAAESAFFQGRYSDTIGYTRTLHSLPHRQYALAHFLSGKSLESEQQPAAALAEYQTFVEEDPTDPNVPRAQELIAVLQQMASSQKETIRK